MPMSIPIAGACGRIARPLFLATLALIAAEDAVSADSDGVLRARWSAALRRDPGDREAVLGLATLARGT